MNYNQLKLRRTYGNAYSNNKTQKNINFYKALIWEIALHNFNRREVSKLRLRRGLCIILRKNFFQRRQVSKRRLRRGL